MILPLTAHEPAPLAGVAALALAYAALAARPGPRRWSRWRTASFVTGCALLALALAVPIGTGFPAHMAQHLLIGMLAPTALVLGAPMTLVLRSLPPPYARRVTAVLRRGPVRVLGHPVTALLLSTGGMAALYCTPLYRLSQTGMLPHHLLHLHFLLAGYLFAWSVAGPDPAPRRPSVPFRLVVLGVAVAVHAGLAQLMYAGLLVDVPAPPGSCAPPRS
ncbi:cytochrome c oxidase assembly protein [Thermocatellispora tengchongensis]|uniref:cytochrome c oxidase assembly protein n=1 Tax=Thermocatellispora tengchongensis TaxID=1073253 RepID=UPI00363DF92A